MFSFNLSSLGVICMLFVCFSLTILIVYMAKTELLLPALKELGHHISDHNAINSTAILFLPYKEAISLDYCQFTGLWVQ